MRTRNLTPPLSNARKEISALISVTPRPSAAQTPRLLTARSSEWPSSILLARKIKRTPEDNIVYLGVVGKDGSAPPLLLWSAIFFARVRYSSL